MILPVQLRCHRRRQLHQPHLRPISLRLPMALLVVPHPCRLNLQHRADFLDSLS
jgi:hypothetical protein